MKWQQVLGATMVLSALLVGMVQEADVAVTEVVEKVEVEQNTFVVTVSPEGGKIALPEYKGISLPAFIIIEKGFFIKPTEVILILDNDTILNVYVDKNYQKDILTPTLSLSFPFANISDGSNSALMRFILFPMQGKEFAADDSTERFDEYIGKLYSPMHSTEEYPFNTFSMLSGNVGTMNIPTLQAAYEGFSDDVEVKLSVQVVQVWVDDESISNNM